MFGYFGGKYNQAKWISSFFPKNIDTYIEVFGGAFWIYIKSDIKSKKVIYNDIDPMMYNLWLCIKQYNKLASLLDTLKPRNREKWVESKKIVKKLMDSNVKITKADFDIVEHFIYWLTHSFSGDINGGMSGSSSYSGLLNRLKKKNIQDKLDRIEVYNESYENIIDRVDSKNTLFYVDPPYYGKEKFYGFHPFTVEDHENLSHILKHIKGKFILSYYRKPEIEKLYPEKEYRWEEKEYKKTSAISKNKKRDVAIEILIMNYSEKYKMIFQ